MNRINVNQIKQVGAFTFLYFLAIGLGVLVGNLVDHQGNMFYAPAFSALFGGTIYRYYLEKIKGVGSIFIVGCVIGSFFLFSRHGAGAFIPALIAGSFAEMVASSGRFRSNLRNALSFVIFTFATTGPILMMWFYPASYRMSLLDRGKSIDYVNRVMVSPDLATITWFILTVILGAGYLLSYFHYWIKKEKKMHNNLLVLQSDFGLVDGAVSAMIGVALEESPTLKIHHLTHDITPYNIFEGSYRLFQTVDYWPEGTTFVSVVDPGVGSKRKSVVAKTAKNQYIVTPDNGTLSFIKKHVGIVAIREISEVKNRRANTEFSYTFHGRDVYAYTGAKLASGHISFEEVGPELSVEHIVEIPVVETVFGDNLVKGAVDILDVRFGSLWTSITREEFNHLAPEFGERFEVTIYNNDMLVYQNQVTYGKSFADVRIGQPILYINSLYRVGLAINQGSFAKAYNVGVGASWHIEIRKMEN